MLKTCRRFEAQEEEEEEEEEKGKKKQSQDCSTPFLFLLFFFFTFFWADYLGFLNEFSRAIKKFSIREEIDHRKINI